MKFCDQEIVYIFLQICLQPVIVFVVKGLALTVALTFASLKPAYSIRCYSCTGVARVADCNVTLSCNQTESCYQEKVHKSHGYIYNLGCRQTQQCQSTSSSALFGRRYLVASSNSTLDSCSDCCKSDICNRGLCWNDPDCFDSHAHECSSMSETALFNLCKDITVAKLRCRRTCGLCDVVDGELTSWSTWSSCDVSCGNGTQTRARTCSRPAPKNGGADCVGNRVDSRSCQPAKCPVHGGWSQWAHWSSCSASCGPGLQRRDRTCSNPKPDLYGDHCFGDSRDDRICMTRACADGGWSHWSSWTSCSVSCGNGFRTRSRDCTSPAPSAYGQACHGQPMDISSCNTRRCPAITSAFSVDQPRGISQSHLTFSHLIFNLGGDFNPSTGIFKCSKPGVYTFTFILVRKKIGSSLICYLRKNSASITLAQFKPFGVYDNDYAYAVNTAMLHLNRGDTVTLYGCSNPASHMESWTSFSGYLLYPDV